MSHTGDFNKLIARLKATDAAFFPHIDNPFKLMLPTGSEEVVPSETEETVGSEQSEDLFQESCLPYSDEMESMLPLTQVTNFGFLKLNHKERSNKDVACGNW